MKHEMMAQDTDKSLDSQGKTISMDYASYPRSVSSHLQLPDH